MCRLILVAFLAVCLVGSASGRPANYTVVPGMIVAVDVTNQTITFVPKAGGSAQVLAVAPDVGINIRSHFRQSLQTLAAAAAQYNLASHIQLDNGVVEKIYVFFFAKKR